MSSQTPEQDDIEVTAALRAGLRLLPVPHVSPSFDAAVLAAVSRPAICWPAVRASLRAVLVGGACSACLSVFLLQAMLGMPATPPSVGAGTAVSAVAFDTGLDGAGTRAFTCIGARFARTWLDDAAQAPVLRADRGTIPKASRRSRTDSPHSMAPPEPGSLQGSRGPGWAFERPPGTISTA